MFAEREFTTAQLQDAILDILYYVADVFVGDPGTGGEADADFEERFADAVDVGGIVLVDGLLVHRLPEGARLDVCGIESHAHCLYVIAGLTVGDCRRGGVGYARSSINSSGDDLLVGVLLSFDFQFGVERSCAEPEVGVVFRSEVGVHCDALDILEQFLIECLDVLVVGDVFIYNRHLTTADASADVANAIVVANGFVLIIRIALACLGSVLQDFASLVGIGADESTAAGGGYHLVAIERQHAVLTECAERLAVEV